MDRKTKSNSASSCYAVIFSSRRTEGITDMVTWLR